MCDLNDDFEDLDMNFTQSEIKMLGWDDKEWIIEIVTFVLLAGMIISLYCF